MNSASFTPYATMFKLPTEAHTRLDEPIPHLVYCVACDQPHFLTDLLSGELNETHCPDCNTTALKFWKSKPHRKLPFIV